MMLRSKSALVFKKNVQKSLEKEKKIDLGYY